MTVFRILKNQFLVAISLVIFAGLIGCPNPLSSGSGSNNSSSGGSSGTSGTVALSFDTGETIANGATANVSDALSSGFSTTTFTVTNSGSGTLTVGTPTFSDAAFTIQTAPSGTVAAGASTNFVVKFTPGTTGAKSSTMTIPNGSSTAWSVNLSGTGVGSATTIIKVAAGGSTVASGGSSSMGGSPFTVAKTFTINISNTGTGAMTGVSASLSGSADFAITTSPATTVAGGAYTSMVVTMTPAKTVAGTRTTTVTVANSSTNAPSYTLTLSGTGTVSSKVYYVTMASTPATAGANFNNGNILLYNNFGSTSNSFAYSSPNFYGSQAQAFIMFPTAMSGDFSISASILTLGLNTNANSGIGIGMTTGFSGTDKYAYSLLSNNSTAGSTSAALNTTYVNNTPGVTNATTSGSPAVYTTASSGSVTSGAATSTLAGTTNNLSFSRSGSTVTLGLASGTPATLSTSSLTDGTTVYGTGSVYPAIAFVRTQAVVTNLVVKDGNGFVVFDSANGGSMGTYYPPALTLASSSTNMNVGVATPITATATAAGYDVAGATSTVTATSANTGVATVAVTNNASNSTVTITGVASGTTTVTVTNTANNATKTIAVTITSFPSSDAVYGSLNSVAYPVPGSSNAYADGELALTFDSAPSLVTGGLIKIYKKSDGSEVDNIAYAGESQNVPTSSSTSTTINVNTQLVRVSGSTLYITPHFGKLAYGTQYYVGIPNGVVTGTLNGQTFVGLSSTSSVATWNFTTRAAPSITVSSGSATINVSNSTGTSTQDFRSLGGAFNYLAANPLSGATAITINVAAGTYVELAHYRPATANLGLTVTIKGPAGNNKGDTCVIQYMNGTGVGSTPPVANATQQNRSSFYFAGANLVLQNLTIQNTAVRATNAQAEALYFDSRLGSTIAANNCSFISRQDTINTTGRGWFYNCYIEGNTDFIWGTSDAALFEGCTLRVYADAVTSFSIMVARTNGMTAGGAYITGSTSGMTGVVGKGYVLLNSTVNVDKGVTAFFGRDAGTGAFFDQVAFINNTFADSGSSGSAGSSATPAIGTGIWNTGTAPLILGDASYVGWKSTGTTGLNIGSLTTATNTTTTINSQGSEYDTRDHILNRVVTVTSGTPTGFQATPLANWDVSGLATAWGAP